jgi:CRISPR-associated protein Cas5t
MSDSICLSVEVPICAFRPYASREYQDTYPVPTPASVYGLLLSLLGVRREDKARHRGVEMALAVESLPERSKVFRKLRRGADLEDIRPDYQDLLTDLGLWVWLRSGKDAAMPNLVERMIEAFDSRFAGIDREGGVSLGESSYLINAISRATPPQQLHFLLPDLSGFYSLPTWVDHADAKNTVLRRFKIEEESSEVENSLQIAWFDIPLAPIVTDPIVVEKPKRGRQK